MSVIDYTGQLSDILSAVSSIVSILSDILYYLKYIVFGISLVAIFFWSQRLARKLAGTD